MLCVLGGVAQAADGVLLVTRTTTTGSEPRTNQVQIESKRMRAESSGAAGEKMIVLFDGTTQVMRLVDNEKKTYTEMTKEDVDAIGGQMSAMMAQMEQQLKSLPPEQRAQVEAMMKGRGMGAGRPSRRKCSTRKPAPTPSASGRATSTRDTRTARRRPRSAPWIRRRSGSALSDFDITRELAAFFAKLMPANAAQVFSIGVGGEQGFSGLPVRSVATVARPTDHDRSDRGHPSEVP